jgi:hypothetical protein
VSLGSDVDGGSRPSSVLQKSGRSVNSRPPQRIILLPVRMLGILCPRCVPDSGPSVSPSLKNFPRRAYEPPPRADQKSVRRSRHTGLRRSRNRDDTARPGSCQAANIIQLSHQGQALRAAPKPSGVDRKLGVWCTISAFEPHILYAIDVPDMAIESASVSPHGWDGDEPVPSAQAIGDNEEQRSLALLAECGAAGGVRSGHQLPPL